MNNPYKINIEKRLAYLEESNLFKMMALDLTRELGEFHSSINQLKTPHTIFENCHTRISQILEFKQMAFLLVNENDSDFYIYHCYPETEQKILENEIDVLIEDNTFSRAVLERKPITAYSKNFDHQILLHVLSTVSRVRGMFVGVLKKKSKQRSMQGK